MCEYSNPYPTGGGSCSVSEGIFFFLLGEKKEEQMESCRFYLIFFFLSHVYTCMVCKCAYTYVQTHVCRCMCVHMCGSPRLLLGIFHNHSPLRSLRQSLSVEPRPHCHICVSHLLYGSLLGQLPSSVNYKAGVLPCSPVQWSHFVTQRILECWRYSLACLHE